MAGMSRSAAPLPTDLEALQSLLLAERARAAQAEAAVLVSTQN